MKKIKLSPATYRELQKEVLERDRYRCVICNSSSGLQIHHLIKRSKLRLDTLNNLVTLCCYHHDLVELNDIKIEKLIIGDELKSIFVTDKLMSIHNREYKINESKKEQTQTETIQKAS